jgi:hypothetical protein
MLSLNQPMKNNDRAGNSPKCNTCKQVSETASQVLCDCEALATLRFRHLG